MTKERYRLGVVSISFRGHTPRQILEATKAAGLSCIEWGSDVHAPCHDAKVLNQIAELQKEYSVQCSSYGTYFRLGETPIEELKDYISAAKVLGTNVLRLWCGSKSGTEYTAEEIELLFEQCKKAASIAEQNDVILCMECHKNTYTQHSDDALKLMQTVNSPHFRIYWQPFQWQSIEENLEYAKKIEPFTRHIHVFQWKGKQRFSLKDGIDEWRAYLCCFSTPRTLLLEFMPDNRPESLTDEAKILKQITGESL